MLADARGALLEGAAAARYCPRSIVVLVPSLFNPVGIALTSDDLYTGCIDKTSRRDAPVDSWV
jgi:hypothetical protein